MINFEQNTFRWIPEKIWCHRCKYEFFWQRKTFYKSETFCENSGAQKLLECSSRIGSNPLCGGCLQKIKRSKFWHIMSKSSVTAQFTLHGCSRSRLSDRYQRNQLPNCTQKKIVKSHHVLKVAKIPRFFQYFWIRKCSVIVNFKNVF